MNQPTKENASSTNEKLNPEILNGFSWGAFGLPLIWCLIMNKRQHFIIVIILMVFMFIPYLYIVGVVGYIIEIIYFGKTGLSDFTNTVGNSRLNEQKKSLKIWNLSGLLGFLFLLLLVAVWVSNIRNISELDLYSLSPWHYDVCSTAYFSRRSTLEEQIWVNSLQLQLDLETFNTMSSTREYPKKVSELSVFDSNLDLKNPISKKKCKVVPIGTFSPGDFSYLISPDKTNYTFMVIFYGIDTKRYDILNRYLFQGSTTYGLSNEGVLFVTYNSNGYESTYHKGYSPEFYYKDSITLKLYKTYPTGESDTLVPVNEDSESLIK